MRFAIGSDHRGYDYKVLIMDYMLSKGHEVSDVGADGKTSVDYPDYAREAATLVSSGVCAQGILICGSGIGMSIAANKIKGVRAALCHNALAAEMSRRHNNANVLTIGADVVNKEDVLGIVDAWLSNSFEGARHQRRIDKISELERSCEA